MESKESFIGKVFGSLEIIGFTKRAKCNYQETLAVCKCLSCGKKDYTGSWWSIKTGKVVSCGCQNFSGYKEITGTLWSNIQRRALRRGHEFKIKIEDAWFLYERQDKKCALSNLLIVFGKANCNKEATASLDRIDPKLGYVVGNVQWVHKAVNIMKNMFEQTYFIDLCRRIADCNPTVRLGDESYKTFDYDTGILFGTKNGLNTRIKDASVEQLFDYLPKRTRIGNKTFWTPEQDKLLMKLRDEGKLQKEIATATGHTIASVGSRQARLLFKMKQDGDDNDCSSTEVVSDSNA